jgi:GxxExxY protein
MGEGGSRCPRRAIIGAAYAVSNELGSGFLEKVYENALKKELHEVGLNVKQQVPLDVKYRGEVVGEYVADLIVEDRIILELKSVRSLEDVHLAQCLNYLKATGYPLCLLVNFYSPKVFIKRIINT